MLLQSRVMSTSKISALLRSSLGSSVLLVGSKHEKSDWAVATHPLIAQKDGAHLSRKIVSPVDKLGLDLRLYQYQTCPYCSKVRSVLDYYGFSYEVVEVNPVTRSQLKFAKGYKKVPVVTTAKSEDALVESSQIISILKSYMILPNRSFKEILDYYPRHETVENGKTVVVYPNKNYIMHENKRLSQDEIQAVREENQWREWVDEKFIHIISPNVYRTFGEALETFHYFDQVGEWKRNFPAWERALAIYLGATAMYFISKRLKKRHGIVDEREAMLGAFKEFLKAKGPDRKFLGGDNPNLADLSLHGAITSFLGTRTFKELSKECEIEKWFNDTQQAINEHRGAKLLADRSHSN
ncbi:Microsomal prostaglandin E synthase 2 [Aphelenchoides bicaudatus]|nr:Microsomal prostaglandin E synthase 2 [Aphelenchoides bicaudatus]